MLPTFGLVVGTLTNWLAMKMIFNPVEPYYVFGIKRFKIQGLFLQRQAEVSCVYAKRISEQVLTSRNILTSLVSGPLTDKLFKLVNDRISQAAVDIGGTSGTMMLKFVIGTSEFMKLEQEISKRIVDALPQLMLGIDKYVDRALDIERTLKEKMETLPAVQFERLLHPVFEEDEWKLILMGGVLGVVIGVVQMFILV